MYSFEHPIAQPDRLPDALLLLLNLASSPTKDTLETAQSIIWETDHPVGDSSCFTSAES